MNRSLQISFGSYLYLFLWRKPTHCVHPEDSCYVSCLSSAKPLNVHCRYNLCVWGRENKRKVAAYERLTSKKRLCYHTDYSLWSFFFCHLKQLNWQIISNQSFIYFLKPGSLSLSMWITVQSKQKLLAVSTNFNICRYAARHLHFWKWNWIDSLVAEDDICWWVISSVICSSVYNMLVRLQTFSY